MRIATYNVEWFADLFNKNDALLLDNERSRRHGVTRLQQLNAIARVIDRMNADVVLIVEAPNTGQKQDTVRALTNFAKHYNLRQNAAVIGFPNDTNQELAILYDPKVAKIEHKPRGKVSNGKSPEVAPRFDSNFHYDVDVDGQPDIHSFSKPPIEALVTDKSSGRSFNMIGVHTKSKAPHGASDTADALSLSIANRRKQLAQCIWIREHVEKYLDAKEPLVVLGDFNDGPGIDGYEALFGRSSVEIVMGHKQPSERVLTDPHANIILDPHQSWAITTARFYNKPYKRYMNAMLDYVMVSEDIVKNNAPRWRIWHPFDDPECYKDAKMRDALILASDHFPVSMDISL